MLRYLKGPFYHFLVLISLSLNVVCLYFIYNIFIPSVDSSTKKDIFMEAALDQAILGLKDGEFPVGAVVVLNNKIIGRGYSYSRHSHRPSDHAEVIAIEAALKQTNSNHFEKGAILYTTYEPCNMCRGMADYKGIESVKVALSRGTSSRIHELSGLYHIFNRTTVGHY
ncbi:MAG: hypothetical protein COV38_02415, partial [Bdellovibrionales bacterium CG11_big_fil_rev_8_21_14_0_20_38_13]